MYAVRSFCVIHRIKYLTAWLCYDILLTASDELSLIWTRKSVLTYVFLATRYLPLLHQILNVVEVFTAWTVLTDYVGAEAAYVLNNCCIVPCS